jgi:hypothetical protein
MTFLHVYEKVHYTVKKGYRISLPQPGCRLPNSPWPGIIIIPVQGEFGKGHPGWGREPANLFYSVCLYSLGLALGHSVRAGLYDAHWQGFHPLG